MTIYKCNGFPSTIFPDSKILIIGTLPPFGRNWYYEKDKLMREILESATNDKFGDTKESKEQFLKRNKIAFWDVFEFAERENSKFKDKKILFNGKEKYNPIWQNIQNVEVIITNGYSEKNKRNAFYWFKKYNGDCVKKDNQDYHVWKNKIKVYPFYSTSYINSYLNGKEKEMWKNLWIETIRNNLDKNSNPKTLKTIVIKKNKPNFKNLTDNLYKLPIEDEFDFYIQQPQNFDYNFPNEQIKVKGFGFYDNLEPKQKQNNHRYYLELDILNAHDRNILTAIMMNPSNTFPSINGKQSTIDDTVKNIIRMAYRLGKYSKVVILNSFALIDGDGDTAQSDADSQKINLAIIQAFAYENTNSDYLLAWGKNAEDTDKIKKILKDNNLEHRIYAYRITEDNYPCHPSRIVENSRKYVSEFLNTHTKNDSFIPYKI